MYLWSTRSNRRIVSENSPISLAEARQLMDRCIKLSREAVEKEMYYRKDDSMIGRLASDLMRYYLDYDQLPDDLRNECKK